MRAPEALQARHDSTLFDSGEPEIDDWLHDHALQSHRAGFSSTFVIHDDDRVLGFYTIAAGSVRPGDAPARVAQGGSRQDIPVMVLARLAVDVSIQHQRIGHWLVRDALLRILQVSGDVGIRAVLVHLKRPSFASFYAEMDFEVSPIDDTKMFLLMKDLRKALGP